MPKKTPEEIAKKILNKVKRRRTVLTSDDRAAMMVLASKEATYRPPRSKEDRHNVIS